MYAAHDRCWPRAARSTPATCCSTPSGCCTRSRTCARGSPSASATCWWTTTRTSNFAQGAALRLLASSTRTHRGGQRRRRARAARPPPRRAEPARLRARATPARRRCGSSTATARGSGSCAPPRRWSAGRGDGSRSGCARAGPAARCASGAAARSARRRRQVAAEAERLIDAEGVAPGEICVLVQSARTRARWWRRRSRSARVPFRLVGRRRRTSSAPRCATCSRGCARSPTPATPAPWCARCRGRRWSCGRSTSRALTQLARRRKLDMVAGLDAALEGPQLSPEGRDRAHAFLRLYRAAARAFETCAPDAFVHRLVERIGLRRQQLFAAQSDTRRPAREHREARRHRRRLHAPRAAAPRRATSPATSPRWPRPGCPRRRPSRPPADAVQVMTMASAKGLEFDHVFVAGLTASRMPGRAGRRRRRARRAAEGQRRHRRRGRARGARGCDAAPAARGDHARAARPRAAWAELGEHGPAARPSPFLRGGARRARRRGGGLRGGAVRPRRGAPLHVPDDARRAARHRRAGGRRG